MSYLPLTTLEFPERHLVTDAGLVALAAMPNLRELRLGLVHSAATEMGRRYPLFSALGIQNLVVLSLTSLTLDFWTDLPEEIQGLCVLRSCALSIVFWGNTLGDLWLLRDLPVTSLSILNNGFVTNEMLEVVMSFSGLIFISLNNCNFIYSIVNLCNPSLTAMDLSATSIDDYGLGGLCSLSRLTSLDLRDTGCTEEYTRETLAVALPQCTLKL